MRHPLLLLAVVISITTFSFLSPSEIFSQDSDVGAGDGWTSAAEKNKAIKESLTLTPKSHEDSREEFEEAVLSGVKEGKTNLKSQTSIITQTLQEQIMTQVLGPISDDANIQAYFGPGAAVLVANLIDGMYDAPPASTDRYVAHVLESAKIIPTAQAQGIGFSSLDPVMTLWSAMRNIAYFFFVIVVLVIGFMIMFRHKIDGQTVISVQQAIPNIIVAMIFVTFSYAIGGLLIDTMYLMLFFIVGIFGASEGLITNNIFGIGAEFIGRGFNTANDAVLAILNVDRGEGLGSFLVEGLSGLTVGLAVAIALLFGIVKLFIELLKSYISIILLIAFSPIILMTGAIPGQNSFGSWIKNLVGNLVAFPVVLLILVTADTIANSAGDAGGFVPPFLLGQGLGRGQAMTGLVGLGMLLATPELIKKAKEAMGAKEGVMGELAGAAWGRLKEGMPVSTRASALGLGTAGGAVVGAGEGMVKAVQGGDILHPKWGSVVDSVAKRSSATRHGLTQGAGWLSRTAGANQPDYANWLVNTMDRAAGVDPQEELDLQRFERSLNVLMRGTGQKERRRARFIPPTQADEKQRKEDEKRSKNLTF